MWAQMVEEDHNGRMRFAEESPFRSEYTLYDATTVVNKAEWRIKQGFLPIVYDYRGEDRFRCDVYGMDLADGITPNDVSRHVQSLQVGYLQDTLYFSSPKFGREGGSVAPSRIEERRCLISAYGAVGATLSGVEARLSNPDATIPYDVWVQGRFGPSAYGRGVDTYEGIVAVSLRLRKWSLWMQFAPSVRHVRTASVDEAFGLTEDQFYNPSCGVFEGRCRNVARRSTMLPVVAAMRQWRSKGCNIGLAVAVRGGEVSRSLLDSYSGLSAYPDHYRSLPSGAMSQTAYEALTEAWRRQEPSVVGIDWAKLQQINQTNGQALYSVNSRVERVASANIAASVSGKVSDVRWRVNARMRYDHSTMFKRIDDLLGATHALNIDYYNSDLSAMQIVHNNADAPHQRLVVGDRIDYNYTLTRLKGGVEGSVRYLSGRLSAEGTLTLGASALSRRGLWRKTAYLESQGAGRFRPFADCAAELIGRYKVQSTALVGAKLWVATAPPDYDNLYLSPENSATIIPASTTPLRYGFEIEADGVFGIATISADLYVQGRCHDVDVRRYYDDFLGVFSNLALTDINTITAGATFSTTIGAQNLWSVSAAVDCHYDAYVSSPRATIFSDVDGSELLQTTRSHLKGFRTGDAPTLTAMINAEGYISGRWTLSGGVCGFAGRYIEPNPLYRMEHLESVCASEEHYRALFQQRRLGGALVLEGSLGYFVPLRVGSLMLRLSARGFVAGDNTFYAYEQLRLRSVYGALGRQYVAAPVKRTYAYPFVATLSISLSL